MIEDAVRGMLEAGGFADVFTCPVSVTAHPECIVVGKAACERKERMADSERVLAKLQVRVCRDTYASARDAAYQVETLLRTSYFEPYSSDAFSINSIDASMPDCKGQDGSGRHVFTLDVEATVDRSME